MENVPVKSKWRWPSDNKLTGIKCVCCCHVVFTGREKPTTATKKKRNFTRITESIKRQDKREILNNVRLHFFHPTPIYKILTPPLVLFTLPACIWMNKCLCSCIFQVIIYKMLRETTIIITTHRYSCPKQSEYFVTKMKINLILYSYKINSNRQIIKEI